ncbi:MAG: acetate--CoA ligase family protein [Candidatus Eisenbacteria bacterium]|nr:acetate--CoA ligase family protein [Candidatus Eisenbacteria bacterium]
MYKRQVLRVASVPEMFELTLALGCQPLPRGRRVAIVTNAGGPGILAADACSRSGLHLVEFAGETREALRSTLPVECSLANPVDLIASAGPDRYRVGLQHVLADPGVDALLVIFVPPVMIDAPGVARAIHEAAASHRETPILGCFMGQQRSFPDLEAELSIRVPFYPYPEEAVRCLDRMARYAELRPLPEGRPFGDVIDRERISTILAPARARGRRDLVLSESLRVAETAGFPVPAWRWVPIGDREESRLAEAAASLGYPVVLKGDAPASVHKADAGLIALGIDSEEALAQAVASLRPRLGDSSSGTAGTAGWVVQRQIPPGREILLGMAQDPGFGPILAVGIGGAQVEGIGDVVFRMNPITDADARAMLDGLRGQAYLDGTARGERLVGRAVDRGALLALLGRLSRLIEEVEEIEELDFNPVVFGEGPARDGLVLDARIRLREADADALPEVRLEAAGD